MQALENHPVTPWLILMFWAGLLGLDLWRRTPWGQARMSEAQRIRQEVSPTPTSFTLFKVLGVCVSASRLSGGWAAGTYLMVFGFGFFGWLLVDGVRRVLQWSAVEQAIRERGGAATEG